MAVARALCFVLVLGGCAPTAAEPVDDGKPTEVSASAPLDEGDLLAKFECNRCHAGLPMPEMTLEKNCVQCHHDIHDGSFAASDEALSRWQKNIVSLRYVPSLAGVGDRLRRDWVRNHLLEPIDVRPALIATMPRLAISEDEADRLASFLVPSESAPARYTPWDRVAGGVLYRELGCGSCHDFKGADTGRAPEHYGGDQRPSTEAAALAPDLSFTRARMQGGRLEQWIASPQTMVPSSLMPSFDLSARQARQLAAYIMLTPLAERATPPQPSRLPLLKRRVSYDEVAARVFRKTCWHCHSEPDLARGDGGPGNSGGFGFSPRGLDLSSYTGVASGSIGPDGVRRSIFKPEGDHSSRLVARLRARQLEEAGRPVPGINGMPLGLPALPAEDIQLVESWLAQGRPRATEE